MEVVVEFLEGNPDRPLISGCVYNGDNSISVGVPDNKTKSTIRTKSSPDSDGYNEMRFEDAAGSEEIFVHAQKDYNEVVENCHSTSVGADQSNSVSGNQTQSITKDQTETVDGHQKMTVAKTRTTEITQDETNTYHANRSTTVEVNELLEVLGTTTIRSGGTVTVEAQKDFKQTVGGKASVTVSSGPAGPGDGSVGCDNNYTVEAKTKIHLSQNAVSTITLAGGGADHVTDAVFNVVAKGDLLLASTAGQLAGQASTKIEFTQGGGGISIEGGKIAIGSPSEITLSVGGQLGQDRRRGGHRVGLEGRRVRLRRDHHRRFNCENQLVMGARGILARISGESTRGADDVELIVGNLKALLNTRLGDAVSAEGFGVVDLVDIIHDFPAAAQIMQRSIRATIAKYEPRLRNVSVRTVQSDDPLTLTFEISGRLAGDKRRGVVRLRSEMTHGGRVTVA